MIATEEYLAREGVDNVEARDMEAHVFCNSLVISHVWGCSFVEG